MRIKHGVLKFMVCTIYIIFLLGCTNKNSDLSNLKSVQVFKKNSGPNYIFISNSLNNEK